MKDATIYSIGHGNKKIEDFIAELKSFEIQFLLDIRSKPYSKWNPQFNQAALDLELENNGITYVFVGDTLGGLPEDRSCYDYNGKVVYRSEEHTSELQSRFDLVCGLLLEINKK